MGWEDVRRCVRSWSWNSYLTWWTTWGEKERCNYTDCSWDWLIMSISYTKQILPSTGSTNINILHTMWISHTTPHTPNSFHLIFYHGIFNKTTRNIKERHSSYNRNSNRDILHEVWCSSGRNHHLFSRCQNDGFNFTESELEPRITNINVEWDTELLIQHRDSNPG